MEPSEEQAARDAFAEWASLQARAPRDAGEVLEEIEIKQEHIGILSTDILGRRVVWKSVPASSRARVTVPTVSLESIDPWNVESTTLRERSDHIAICESCGGEKKVRCANCGGTGKLLCNACGGQRKMYGYAANGSRRLLNCTGCRGKGEIDCSDCRRGIASCGTCGGEGRLQRWIELEWWRRSIANVHPESLTPQFGWNENVSNEAIARDADLVFEIDKPHRLTASDLGNVSLQWLSILDPPLQAGERIAHQRLRIARAPFYTIHYRLGSDEDRAVFAGRRLFSPPAGTLSAFARRASRLASVAWLLVIIGIVITILSLGRGAFYASIATFFSLVAVVATLFMTYSAVADWTAKRRHTPRWLFAAAACFVVALAFAFAALPRLGHARNLLAANNLDDAERELDALGTDAPATTWADLRLAQIRGANDADAARELLAKIPRELPQHAAAAPLVYLPLVQRELKNANWNGAANAILEARGAGIDRTALDPLGAVIREAADTTITAARNENDAAERLRMRLRAESTLVAWERASDSWGTPPVIALRTAMARDVATLEKPARRKRR